MTARTRDSATGYKRPPTHSRFKPGESGNPRGRPKGTRNLATDLTEELSLRIALRDGDRRRVTSKQRALISALVDKGVDGDTRAIDTVFRWVARVIGATAETSPKNAELSADDVAILEDFLDRGLRARRADPGRTGR